MSGRSGKAIASHTPLIAVGKNTFALTPSQMMLVRRAKMTGGATGLSDKELKSAEKLQAIGAGRVEGQSLSVHEVVEILQIGRSP